MSPCALVLGLLYIQRLAKINPHYLKRTTSSDVFLTAIVSTPRTLLLRQKSLSFHICYHILSILLLPAHYPISPPPFFVRPLSW